MLPSASPPGPSCSQASALKSDEIEPPNFSIRDYVFNLRNEDIKKNWPFPQKFLQVCLKHDVKDLLPPFESHCSVRAKCCNNDNIVVSSEDANNINQTLCLSSINQLVVENLSEKETMAVEKVDILDGKLIDGEAEILTTIISHDQVVCKSDRTSENRLEDTSEREVAVSSPVVEVPNISRQRAEKKRKLIVKLSPMPQSSRAEDMGTASASVSDLMASKVCPVCKTFASSSNTTLNAHIDQCLSEESNAKLVVTNSLKVQVKPRKKKLMMEIYNTAPLCTLLDLDKRNGTNWASDLSLVAPSSNVSCEIKRPKLSPGFIDKGNNEGAVYVDSNGIKIRILSKFDDAPSTMSGKGFKKKHLKAKYLQYLKVNTPKKKLSKRQSSSEGDCHLNTNQKIRKEESLSDLNTQDHVPSLGPATLGQWVCSKRSDMSRKLRNKKFSKSSVNLLPITKKLLSNQTDSIKTSVGRKHILKLSRLSEDLAPSTTTKIVDSVDEIVKTTNEKKSPKPPVFDPLLSSFEVLKSSCKESCRLSPKAGKDSSLKKNGLLQSRCFMGAEGDSGSKNLLISKKLRKHRSVGSGKWGSEFTSCDDGLGSVKAKKLSDHHEVNFSDDTVMPGTSDAADQVHSRTIGISESHQGKEFFDISEMQKLSSRRFNSGEKLDMRMGNAVADEISISDNQILDAKTRLDNLSSREEHLELICGNETLGELPNQRSVDAEKMQCNDIVNNGITEESTLVESEATFHVKDTSSLQLEECHTGSTCIEKSITCSKECVGVGVGLEISQEKSSITSIKNHMLMNRDPSGSPDSTASTMSHASRDFEVKDKEMVDNSASSLINIRTEGQEAQKASKELTGMSPVKPIERLRDSQPCCCSHRESLFREAQLVRQCRTPKMASLSKGNQMSSNSHIQQATCCSIPCPCLRTKNNISAITSSDSLIKLQNPILRLMGKDLVVNHDVLYNRLEHSSANCAPDRVSVPCYYHQYSDSSPFTSQVSWAANQPMYFQSHDMMFAGDSSVIGSKSRLGLQSHKKRSTNQPMNERGMNSPAAALFPNLIPHSSLYSSPLTLSHPFLSIPRPISPAKMMRQRSIPDGSAPLLPNTTMFPSPSSSNHLTPFY
ncbi:hypothetical protein DsansV1_C46g0241671 [Dioscorea sansibarensis]